MKKLSCSGRIHPIFLFFIVMALAVPMGFYGMYLYIYPSLPDMTLLKEAPLEQPLQVYTRDNQLIAEFGEKLSIPVKYENIPKPMIQAFLAAEDASFFEHNGVSFKGLGRALNESVGGGGAQTGGSTITMQVAKNYYLTPERTLRRKLTEIFLARKIEQTLTKEEIFSLYVNKIFLGKNAYGIGAAAKVYYNKRLNQLTLAEMAMISGLPKAPSKYNPVANPTRALERRNWILGRMQQLGFISPQAYEAAIQEPIRLNMQEANHVDKKFPYLAELVRAEMVKRFGPQVMNSGYRVYTTVDSKRQASAQAAVQMGLEAYDRRHGWRGPEAHDKPLADFVPYANTWPVKVTKVRSQSFDAVLRDGKTVTVNWDGMSWARKHFSADRIGNYPSSAKQIVKTDDIVRVRPNEDKSSWSLIQIPAVQGQLISLNPNNGAVEAIVGGYDFAQSKFNRAVQGWRQPGSTIKPFIYTLALERGMNPYSVVSDSPLSVGKWHPQNSDGRYLGAITLRKALYLSRNLVSIRLLQSVGLDRARNYLVHFGLIEDRIPRNLTIALGTPQVLPIQMATGYAAFANGGYRIQPYVIDKVLSPDGEMLFEADPLYACASCQGKPPAEQAATDGTPAESLDQVIELSNGKDGKNLQSTVAPAAETDKPVSTPAMPVVAVDPNAPVKTYRQAERIVKATAAFDMANILKDVIIHGTGRAALKLGRDDLGGKTGTTNDAKDAWFAGFNADLVTVTWVGFDQPRTLGRREYGGVAALPIWIKYMGEALENMPSRWVTLGKDAEEDSTEITNLDPAAPKLASKTRNATPPLATPLYKPKPLPVEILDKFEDLPDMDPDDDATVPKNNVQAKPATPAATSPHDIF